MVGAVHPAYDIVGWADCTGDGRADILWHHQVEGSVRMWVMNDLALESATRVATVPDTGFRVQHPKSAGARPWAVGLEC